MKKDSRTDILQWTLQNCSEYLFIEQLQQLLLEQILNRLWLYVWFCFESEVNNLNHFISVAAHKFSEIRNFRKNIRGGVSFFQVKIQALLKKIATTLLKRDSDTGVFL